MQGAQVPSQIVEIGSNMLCCVTKKIEKEKIKNWSEEGPKLARDERRKAEKEEERTGEGARPWSRLAQGTTWGPHGDHRGTTGDHRGQTEPILSHLGRTCHHRLPHRVRGRISASLGFHMEICGQQSLAPRWHGHRQRCTWLCTASLMAHRGRLERLWTPLGALATTTPSTSSA